MKPLVRRMLIGLLIGPMVGALAFALLLHGPLAELHARRFPNQPPVVRERAEQRLTIYLILAGTLATSVVVGLAGHVQLFKDRRHPSLGSRIAYVGLFAVGGAVLAQGFRPVKGPPNILLPVAAALLGWTWLATRHRQTMRAITTHKRDNHAQSRIE